MVTKTELWPAARVSIIPIEGLSPFAENARTHSDAQVAKIADSMLEFGWTNPVLRDEDSTIIAGHGRMPERHEALIVQGIFERFLECGSATNLVRHLDEAGVTNRRGDVFDKSAIYRMLNNKVYIGRTVHKGEDFEGEHKAIITMETWERVHAILEESPRKRAAHSRGQTPALLKGILFGSDGRALSPHHTRKKNKLYRYYVSQTILKHGAGTCDIGRLPAGEIETRIVDHVRLLFQQPDFVSGIWKAARQSAANLTENEVLRAVMQFDDLWAELFPDEQARMLRLVIEQICVHPDRIDIKLWPDMQALWDEIYNDPDCAAWA